jgi:hypothetical protein
LILTFFLFSKEFLVGYFFARFLGATDFRLTLQPTLSKVQYKWLEHIIIRGSVAGHQTFSRSMVKVPNIILKLLLKRACLLSGHTL